MVEIPYPMSLDSTIALLRNPYHFISETSESLKSDIFQTRLMLQNTICMRGAEAAELFYDNHRFMRKGAMPARVTKTLTGQNGVQSLDGVAHQLRKQLFMKLVSPERVEALVTTMRGYLRQYAREWVNLGNLVLYDEMREILCRAVCDWAGVSLKESEVKRRTKELSAMFEDAGAVGIRHGWSRLARKRGEKWIEGQIKALRSGKQNAPTHAAACAIAMFRDADGEALKPRIAAVELLNILRPTVAVAVFITFAAHALHHHIPIRDKLRKGDERYLDAFVQEVRRFYPFFPAAVARVRHDFNYRGYDFRKGTRVMLDLYGTNHDARHWKNPELFQPERFLEWDGNAFDFIPQGGGNPNLSHRCPGEGITIALMKEALRFLLEDIRYDVPLQDLRIETAKMPALPKSRFVMNHVWLNF